jgi:hypothetical protein
MKRPGSGPRQRRCLLAALVGLGAAAAAAPGCVEIDGGAVEVPWAIFAPDGRAITDCACAEDPTRDPPLAVERMRLELVSEDGSRRPCDGRSSCTFACSRKIGATPFVIEPGRYNMSLTPLGAGDTPLMLEATTPVLRDVVRGQPTELEAWMFTAGCSARCRGASATEPCTDG